MRPSDGTYAGHPGQELSEEDMVFNPEPEIPDRPTLPRNAGISDCGQFVVAAEANDMDPWSNNCGSIPDILVPLLSRSFRR